MADESWESAKGKARYRASIDGDAFWDLNRPLPSLCTAMVRSSFNRLLMAFDLAEVRDLFLEGHLDQGCQTEDDWADEATPLRKQQEAVPDAGMTLDDAFQAYRHANGSFLRARNDLTTVFGKDVEIALDVSDWREAVGIYCSMPQLADTYRILSQIRQRYGEEEDLLRSVRPSPYTQDRAAACLNFMRAQHQRSSAASSMGALLEPLVERMIENGDAEGLQDLIARTPASFEKASMLDALNYRMPEPGPGRRM